MPQLVTLTLPDWAQWAYDVVGSRPGLAVLMVLLGGDEPMALKDIALAVGLNHQRTSVALRALEDAGVVQGSVPRDERLGRSLVWQVDRVAVAQVLRGLQMGLLGSDVSGPGR